VDEDLDQLLKDITTRPVLKCPFTFNWSGSEEDADSVALLVTLFAQYQASRHPFLDFSRLVDVGFYDDYEAAVRRFAPKGGGATREVWGEGLGMTLRSSDGSRVLLDGGVARSLMADDMRCAAVGRGMVLHELCHVSDFNFKQTLEFTDRTASGQERFVGLVAESLWDEYFANKYSHGSWSDPNIELTLLQDALPPLFESLDAARQQLRSDGLIEPFMALVEESACRVAQYFGYAAGRLDAMKTTLHELAPKMAKQLGALKLLQAWETAFAALKRLDAERPGWKSRAQLQDLVPACVLILASFGIGLREDGQVKVF
jgi:hypothetical protein